MNLIIKKPSSVLIWSVIFFRYECSAVNENGRTTSQALVKVRREGATDSLVFRAFQEATQEIDRAVNNTLASLFSADGSRRDPFRLARFPNAVARAQAKPAEVFERTLVNIRRMINAGMSANATDDFHYSEILTSEQVIIIFARVLILKNM